MRYEGRSKPLASPWPWTWSPWSQSAKVFYQTLTQFVSLWILQIYYKYLFHSYYLYNSKVHSIKKSLFYIYFGTTLVGKTILKWIYIEYDYTVNFVAPEPENNMYSKKSLFIPFLRVKMGYILSPHFDVILRNNLPIYCNILFNLLQHEKNLKNPLPIKLCHLTIFRLGAIIKYLWGSIVRYLYRYKYLFYRDCS
jgi:hypothetical protein